MSDLRDLGLSEYGARAYRGLLRTGTTTAKELSRVSGVPMGRVYDVLGDLEERGLVRSQSATRPKRYVPVDPETALERLLAAREAELEEERARYEEAVAELAAELEEPAAVDEGFWTAAVGPEETVDLLLERLGAANAEVVMAARTPAFPFDMSEVGARMTDEVDAALDRGVEVSVLVAPALVERLPAGVGRRIDRLLGREAFEARVADVVAGTFTLVDGREVCVEVPHPLDPEEAFALVALSDREFAAEVREVFEPRWAEAERLAPLGVE